MKKALATVLLLASSIAMAEDQNIKGKAVAQCYEDANQMRVQFAMWKGAPREQLLDMRDAKKRTGEPSYERLMEGMAKGEITSEPQAYATVLKHCLDRVK